MGRNIKLLALFNFFTDFKFHSAVLIIYFAQVTGSYTLAMSLFSVVMVSAALFEMPTGIFSDLIGRKKTIILGAISAIISAILYATGQSYWPLFMGALFEGMSRSWYSGNNDALLHDSLKTEGKENQYDHYLGKISAMFQAALTIGAVGGSILASWSYAWVMWLSVIPQLICFLISLYIKELKVTSKEQSNIYSHLFSSVNLLYRNKKLRLLSVNQILGFGIGEAAFHFKSVFIATLWPLWAVGIPKMISFIGGGISFWFSGRLIRKFGGIHLMIIDATINRVINIFSLLFPTVASPIIMSCTSFLYGVTEVASNSLMQKEFTDKERATLSSITSFFGSIFYGIFSLLIGFIADITSPISALLFAEICSIPRILIMRKIYKTV